MLQPLHEPSPDSVFSHSASGCRWDTSCSSTRLSFCLMVRIILSCLYVAAGPLVEATNSRHRVILGSTLTVQYIILLGLYWNTAKQREWQL